MYQAANDRYGKMAYVRCGKSGLQLPAISLGLWHNFGDTGVYENMKEILFTAFDNGIVHFDLANNYGPAYGSAEKNFGKILKEELGVYRDELLISTKAGFDMWEGPYGNWGSRKYLLSSLDQSLKRMGLDYVDIFYHHRMDPETPLEETMGALASAVQSGKALYVGLSNYDGPTLEKAEAILRDLKCPFVINQNRYSIFDRTIEKNGLKDTAKKLEKTLDERVLVKELLPALEKHQKRSLEVDVTNTNRTFGTIFGSEITRRYPEGVEEDSYVIKCTGAGGQSFGAFIPKGLTLELVGDGNDYFGKGLSGGKLIVYPPKGVTFKHEENIIIGNVALYGATSGKAFINGVAGERFAVRNSGAKAVVEGVGDHGCEYMTGGCVVVLGKTGKNFAAGMSGGVAYVLDLNSDLYKNINKQMVNIERVTSKFEINELKEMIEEHVAYTNSESGKEILDHFTDYLPKFKKIIPIDYEKMLSTIVQMEEQGMSSEQARIEAFYAIKEGRR